MASTGTAVAVRGKSTALAYVDPRQKLDYSFLRNRIDSARSSRRPFAGNELRFNGQRGKWTVGFGDQAKQLKQLTLVANIPNFMEAWRYWPDNEAPSYPQVVTPMTGGALKPRSEMGPEETKYDKLKKAAVDVFDQCGILIFRNPKTNELYHFIGTVSKLNALYDLISDAIDTVEKTGKLPLVELGNEEVTNKKTGETFLKPTFTISEWVKPTDLDAPAGMTSAGGSDAEEDDEEDEEAGDAADDDEAEEDQKPVSKKGKGRAEPATTKGGKFARRTVLDADDEDDDADADTDSNEDDEDDEPVVVIKKKKRLN